MFNTLIVRLIGLFFPKLPQWLLLVVLELFQAIVGLVEAAQESTLTFEEWSDQLESILDRALDTIPGWSDLHEKNRDSVLRGLFVLVVWLHQMSSVHDRSAMRRFLRTAGTQMRADLRSVERAGVDFADLRQSAPVVARKMLRVPLASL